MGIFDVQPRPTIANIMSGPPLPDNYQVPATAEELGIYPQTTGYIPGSAGTGNVYGPPVPAAAPAPTPAPVGSGAPSWTPTPPAAPIAPAIPRPTLDDSVDTLKKTSEYADYLRRRTAAEELFKAGQGTEKTRYTQDYTRALEDLGWQADKNAWDQGELMSSGQKATTAGRAFNTLRNDYAARGMARSGAKQVAEALLRNQLGTQLSEQNKAKTRFEEDQASKLSAFTAEQDTAGRNALAQAKQAVLDRYAADLAAWNAGA